MAFSRDPESGLLLDVRGRSLADCRRGAVHQPILAVKSGDTTSTNVALWFGLLAGAVAWSAHELLSYAFVKVACEFGVSGVLHVFTLATLLLAGLGAVVAFR